MGAAAEPRRSGDVGRARAGRELDLRRGAWIGAGYTLAFGERSTRRCSPPPPLGEGFLVRASVEGSEVDGEDQRCRAFSVFLSVGFSR